MPKIVIDRNSCIQCGACVDICYSRQVLLTLGYPTWQFHRMVPRRMPDIKWNP